jgi:hypothetical protein
MEPRPTEISVRGRLRLGDAGRERAAGVLKRAYAKGQLSKPEFERRISTVYAATIRNDLRPVLQDLEEYQLVRANKNLWRYWLD